MPRITIPEDLEEVIDHLMLAKDGLDALDGSRSVALAKTSLQQALLWLLSPSIADALEADGLEEASAGNTSPSSNDEGVGADAS